jgi:hypothetical protein
MSTTGHTASASPIDPRTCTHPNLFGCDGHCVWCDAQVKWGPRLAYSAPSHRSDDEKTL